MGKHFIIFSHGFGVRQDDRGLFTDIAAKLRGIECILFDYNQVDTATNTITVAPLNEQTERLRQVVDAVRTQNPDATIDLIAHSQGCVVAGLANPSGIRRIVLTAPPPKLSAKGMVDRWQERQGIHFDINTTSRIVRQDRTILVPPHYWKSLSGIDAQKLYSQLAEHAPTTIIAPTQDEVLGNVIFDNLSPKITMIPMDTGHNFEGKARRQLAITIAKELGIGQVTNEVS
ncbi:MAG TPA: alpha/beta hydrolase [Nevskiaceae bacterium]|nr:alpha/beta hydrolase [Nevskiaceae bacterium]